MNILFVQVTYNQLRQLPLNDNLRPSCHVTAASHTGDQASPIFGARLRIFLVKRRELAGVDWTNPVTSDVALAAWVMVEELAMQMRIHDAQVIDAAAVTVAEPYDEGLSQQSVTRLVEPRTENSRSLPNDLGSSLLLKKTPNKYFRLYYTSKNIVIKFSTMTELHLYV